MQAIIGSKAPRVSRDNTGLRQFLRRLFKSTKTFFVGSGEITPTLEDVSIILRLPVVGADPLPPGLAFSAIEHGWLSELNKVFASCKSASPSQRVNFASWMRYFRDRQSRADGAGGSDGASPNVSLDAFLAYWLARFSFPSALQDLIPEGLFTAAVRLASGQQLALALVFLENLYRDLDMLFVDKVLGLGRFCIKAHVAVGFLQVFLWERIKEYAPE